MTVLIFCILFIYKSTLFAAQDKKEVKISGIIQASDWDEDGNVIAVVISVEQEVESEEELMIVTDEYLVFNDETGEKLLELAGESVEVTGQVVTDEDGFKTIYVKKFKVIVEEEY